MGVFIKFQRMRRARLGRNGRITAISPFTIFLLGLGLLFWSYFIVTLATLSACEFAAIWIAGWFEQFSTFQLFVAAFVLALAIWLLQLIQFRELSNKTETVAQGVFILGLIISSIFLKSLLFAYAVPSFTQTKFVANILSPMKLRLEAEPVGLLGSKTRPAWPYEFPPPPTVPSRRDWFAGYSPSMEEIFTSKNSPTFGEYAKLLQCAADYRRRARDREKAIAASEEWRRRYSWRTDPTYLFYDWDGGQ
ncbi:MAG: hypothetical protein AAGJ73_04425 [Pseudomonadota bacterium]